MTRYPESATSLCNRTVGEVVAEDYRRADVFKRFGIDFCCGGEKTVSDAATARGIACDDLLRALEEAEMAPVRSLPHHQDARTWEPDFLASYIVNVHHRYIREQKPRLLDLSRTVASVHGDTHPETVQIAALVDELTRELVEHATKEEQTLFPYIGALCAASRGGDVPAGNTDGAIEVLEDEHDHAGALMREIRMLSGDFRAPDAACNTFRMLYAELDAFEADLHRHVHLENNVLFPAAVRLQQSVAATF